MSERCVFPWAASWATASTAPVVTPGAAAQLAPSIKPNQNGIYEILWDFTCATPQRPGNIVLRYGGSLLDRIGRLGSNSRGSLFVELAKSGAELFPETIQGDGTGTYTINYLVATLVGREFACYAEGRK